MDGVLGSYRIVSKLGEGGMGAVYLAEHALLGRRAAVKVLQPALSANQDIVHRFFNEARAATAIADPGIVQIFDFGYDAGGSAYIVMEFLEGEALDARIKRLGRLEPADALRVLRQVSSSLHAAHTRGIIHRDLKPENIFLVPDREVAGGERAKLLDFGIAKLTNDTSGVAKTATAAIMGTPMYMSPEQCRGAGHVDHRSDLYSLGCVLFTMLVGRPPFQAEGIGDLIAMHLREAAPPPSSLVPGTPPALDALVQRLLAKSPDQRFATAADLAAAIDLVLAGGVPAAASTHPGVHGSATPSLVLTTLSGAAGAAGPAGTVAGTATRKRGPLIAVGAAVAVAAAIAIAVVASSGSSGASGSAGSAGGAAPPAAAAPAAAAPGSAAAGSAAAGSAAAAAPAPVAAPAPAAEPALVVAAQPVDASVAAPPPPEPVAAADKSGSGSGSGHRPRKPKPPPAATTTTTTTTTKPPPVTTSGVPGDKDGDGIPDER